MRCREIEGKRGKKRKWAIDEENKRSREMEDGSERERGIGERECRKWGDANHRILRARERSCTRSLATTKEGKIAKCRERETRKYGAEEGRREVGQEEEKATARLRKGKKPESVRKFKREKEILRERDKSVREELEETGNKRVPKKD